MTFECRVLLSSAEISSSLPSSGLNLCDFNACKHTFARGIIKALGVKSLCCVLPLVRSLMFAGGGSVAVLCAAADAAQSGSQPSMFGCSLTGAIFFSGQSHPRGCVPCHTVDAAFLQAAKNCCRWAVSFPVSVEADATYAFLHEVKKMAAAGVCQSSAALQP